jgi:hypothetical protein
MRFVGLFLALSFSGCGGAATTVELGTGSDAASDSSRDGLAEGIAERNPQCPVSVPSAGSPCEPPLECEYGAAGDMHHVCSTRADCDSSDGVSFKWSLTFPPAGCGTNAVSCPVTFTDLADGAVCPGVTSFCEYSDGLCTCVPCTNEAGLSSMWNCGAWANSGSGCPSDRPLSGDACATPNQECSYGGCDESVEPTMVCRDGYWQLAGQTGTCVIPQCALF